ncbi:hypothetical protein AXF42_Ash020248 [Apostasia shenzhenica]|uniref:Uncharacterized protein n=1 Tax=Apostasia shenzhenica TaxID=1088818 RepID=A0A2I0AVT2_9ASPA|nr:hypothetical protein AXF42_Ash020248 [Apostasia shenzhenica]
MLPLSFAFLPAFLPHGNKRKLNWPRELAMTELCSSADSTPLFLLLHDLLCFTSFIFSHPLLFSYILLLHPHLLHLLCFLSPLLLSTSLLLLSLLTIPPTLHHPPPLGRTFAAVLTLLRSGLGSQPAVDFTEQLSSMFLHSPNSCSEHLDRQWLKEGLRRDGSMRSREKEWKRTLACKLYEERMTAELCEERKAVDGAEEMDLLWEAYEVHAAKSKGREKWGRKPAAVEEQEELEEAEDEDEEDEEEALEKLCCLQALRLSAGKMNLGMGRPSLMKISKALKGTRFFRRAGRRARKGSS